MDRPSPTVDRHLWAEPGVGEAGGAPGNAKGPAPSSATPGVSDHSDRRARRWLPPAIACVIYLALALFAYSHTSVTGSTRLPQYAGGDQAQEVWFLAWPVYAITHGHNPFFTTWMNYPRGVNLTDNTAMPLLGILGMPVTLTLGPVAAYNLLLVTAFTSSALAMCLALRRWVRWWPAAFAGGLLYGFSPFMIGQGNGHLFLTFVPIPPIIMLVLDEIAVRQQRSPVRMGILLGALAATEYYVSPEVFAMTAVMAAIGILLLAVTHPHLVRTRARYVLRALFVGGVLCTAAIAYPVWLVLFGPQHIVGPPHTLASLAAIPGDLLGGIIPTASQHLGPAGLKAVGNRLTGGDVTENGMYLGIPLICVLAGLTWAFRKVRVLVFASAMVVCAYTLALGPRLTIDGHMTGFRMPFTILRHIPFLQDILAVRFSLFVQLFAAAALAIGLDRLWWKAHTWRPRVNAPSLRPGPRWAPFVVLVGAVALVPLVPAIPYSGAPTDIPTVSVGRAPNEIRPGSVVLSYPYTRNPVVPAMLLQATDNMGFKIVGGDAFIPSVTGTTSYGPDLLPPTSVQAILYTAYSGPPPGTPWPPINVVTTGDLRTFLRRYNIDTVVVERVGLNPRLAVNYVISALGPPQQNGATDIWFDVPKLLGKAE